MFGNIFPCWLKTFAMNTPEYNTTGKEKSRNQNLHVFFLFLKYPIPPPCYTVTKVKHLHDNITMEHKNPQNEGQCHVLYEHQNSHLLMSINLPLLQYEPSNQRIKKIFNFLFTTAKSKLKLSTIYFSN